MGGDDGRAIPVVVLERQLDCSDKMRVAVPTILAVMVAVDWIVVAVEAHSGNC